jgi:hypothetical protein
MQIRVTRGGGFVGLVEELAAVDTDRLDPDSAVAIERQVREIGFFELPAELGDDNVGADQFRYTITVTEAGRQHAVSYTEGGPGGAAATGVRSALHRLVDSLIRAG